MNKYNLFGAIGVVGVLCYVFAAWAKITHHHPQFSEQVFMLGIICMGITAAALVWFLFQYLKRKNL